MADHFLSTDKGDGLAPDVVIATSTQAGTCELRIHDGSFTNKTDVLKCLRAIEAAIIASDAIPT